MRCKFKEHPVTPIGENELLRYFPETCTILILLEGVPCLYMPNAIKGANAYALYTSYFARRLGFSKQIKSQYIMKIFSAVLTLLFLQQAVCTHLETCECHEIKALVNATVEQAITRLEEKFNDKISKVNNTVLTSTIKSLLEPIQKQLNYHLPPPSPQDVFTESNPAQ